MKEHIGRYQVEKKLGEGGMGSVHLAYDPMLDRHVAIKVMSPALASDQTFVQRFLLEARAVARMEHPHIVAVYDANVTDGLYYLVMEYVSGGSLEDLIRQKGRLSLSQVADIIEQVASGLDYAHSHQMVHRDIKPNNILFDTDGKAHVTDFGLVKTEEVALTQVGQIFGTPAYMAPEQIEGQPVGPYTDVYALAVVAYKMLAERLPFEGSMATIFDGHVRRSPPPLSQLNANIPPSVQAAVFQALGKEHNRRFKSAGAFAKAFRNAVQASSSDHIPTEMFSQPKIDQSRRPYQPPIADDMAETIAESGPLLSNQPQYAATIPESASKIPSPPPAAHVRPSAPTAPPPPNRASLPQQQANIPPNHHDQAASPWGKRLLVLAGAFFVTICVCTMLFFVFASAAQDNQSAASGSTNEPPATLVPPAATSSPSNFDTGSEPDETIDPLPTIPVENAPPVNLDYRTIVDETGRLEVQVPTEWAVTDSGDWLFNDQPVGRYLLGTTNLDQVLDGWQVPGVFFAASKELVSQYSIEELLDSYSYADECSLIEQADYDDGFYTGRYDLWGSCGGVDAATTTIIATPPNNAYVILVQIQMITEEDAQAVNQILASLVVRE